MNSNGLPVPVNLFCMERAVVDFPDPGIPRIIIALLFIFHRDR